MILIFLLSFLYVTVSTDWCSELDSALDFLAGEKGPHPDDFVPYLQFIPDTQVISHLYTSRVPQKFLEKYNLKIIFWTKICEVIQRGIISCNNVFNQLCHCSKNLFKLIFFDNTKASIVFFSSTSAKCFLKTFLLSFGDKKNVTRSHIRWIGELWHNSCAISLPWTRQPRRRFR